MILFHVKVAVETKTFPRDGNIKSGKKITNAAHEKHCDQVLLLFRSVICRSTHLLQFIFLSDCGFRFPLAHFPTKQWPPSTFHLQTFREKMHEDQRMHREQKLFNTPHDIQLRGFSVVGVASYTKGRFWGFLIFPLFNSTVYDVSIITVYKVRKDYSILVKTFLARMIC